jgi:endonuclease G
MRSNSNGTRLALSEVGVQRGFSVNFLQKNSIVFLSVVFLSSAVSAKIEKVLGLPLNQNPNLGGFFPASENPEIILSRKQFVISYNKERRAPNWVAWKLEEKNIGTVGRSAGFSQDKELEQFLAETDPNYHAVTPSDYTGSCMDRGHQVPSADRTDAVENNKITFEMSNMIPQTPFINRGVWAELEQYARDLVQKENKTLYIIAGPVYDEDFGAIGKQKDIPVPSKDFKIIVILNSNQNLKEINSKTPMITVMMPNVDSDGRKPVLGDGTTACPAFEGNHGAATDWQTYQTTLAEIQKRSGLKIFSAIP